MNTPLKPVPDAAAAVVLIDETSLRMALGLQGRVAELRHALGLEYERHLNAVAHLKKELEATQQNYASLVEVLAEQHVKKRGKYTFRPELGGFTEQED